MKQQRNIDSSDQSAFVRCDAAMDATAKTAGFHRLSWQEAIGKITSPAFRLHRYRQVHNRLLLDALCELDCSDAGDCGT